MNSSAAAHPDNSPDEMVEEIDLVGNVLQLVTRRKMRAEQLCHRSVFIAVISEKATYLFINGLPRRTSGQTGGM